MRSIHNQPNMTNVLLIAIAGAAGTLARYYSFQLANMVFGVAFPWGTLTVNALGSLLFGFVWAISEKSMGLSIEMRNVLLIGFMGSYTTFSTFAFDAGILIRNSQWTAASLYAVASVVTAIAAFFIGNAAGAKL